MRLRVPAYPGGGHHRRVLRVDLEAQVGGGHTGQRRLPVVAAAGPFAHLEHFVAEDGHAGQRRVQRMLELRGIERGHFAAGDRRGGLLRAHHRQRERLAGIAVAGAQPVAGDELSLPAPGGVEPYAAALHDLILAAQAALEPGANVVQRAAQAFSRQRVVGADKLDQTGSAQAQRRVAHRQLRPAAAAPIVPGKRLRVAFGRRQPARAASRLTSAAGGWLPKPKCSAGVRSDTGAKGAKALRGQRASSLCSANAKSFSVTQKSGGCGLVKK